MKRLGFPLLLLTLLGVQACSNKRRDPNSTPNPKFSLPFATPAPAPTPAPTPTPTPLPEPDPSPIPSPTPTPTPEPSPLPCGADPRVGSFRVLGAPKLTSWVRPLDFALEPQCGDTVVGQLRLEADLDCPNTTGTALSLTGDGSSLDGNGFRIHAPQASAGLYVSGAGVTITKIQIRDVSGGAGLFAYDTPSLTVTESDLSCNASGAQVYGENRVLSGVVFRDNRVQLTADYGLRISGATPNNVTDPLIERNDFAASDGWAMHVSAAHFSFDGSLANRVTGSMSALYLTGATHTVRNLDWSQARLRGTGVMGAEIQTFRAEDLNLAMDPAHKPAGGWTQSFVAYRVHSLEATRLQTSGADIGVWLTTDSGYSTNATVTNSVSNANAYGGVVVRAWDATAFGTLQIHHNDLRLNPDGYGLRIESGTTYAPDSALTPNDL